MQWWGSKNKQENVGGLTVSRQLQKDASLSSDFILGAIEDGVVIVSKDRVVHLFNPAASHITGWAATDAVGLDYQSILKLVDEKDQPYPPESHPIAKTLSDGKVCRDSRALLVTRANNQVPISMIVSPITDANGRQSGSVVAVIRDTTTERAQERQRTEFISTASHEMRTPIAAIEGYLSLALNEKVAKVDDRARGYLQKAHDATTHLGELFQDLLTSSKAEDGRIANFPQVVELGEIVQQVAESARFTASKKGLGLKFMISSEQTETGDKIVRPLFYCNVDPNRIREVVQNLVDNAIKYTQDGEINVAVTGNSSVIQVQVKDTGPGIPEEDLGHLFQKFYRVDTSLTRTVGGTGLGLYIAKKIVELYSGRIWAESQLGKGSTFFVNLPRLDTGQALTLQQTQANTVRPLG